jgi:sugar lactone lactonase YvrE
MINKMIRLLIILLVLCPGWTVLAADQPAEISTLAGNAQMGYRDGDALTAKFLFPSGAAVGKDGTVYISDTANHRIRALLPDGKVITVAGNVQQQDNYGRPVGGYVDGLASIAMFNEPKGLALDDNGILYVADSGNGAIRAVDPSGLVRTVRRGINTPTDVVVGKGGELFVSETLNHRILKIAQTGDWFIYAGGDYKQENGWFVGGYADGPGMKAQFNEPTGLALGTNGVLYVADTGNQRIRAVSPLRIVTTVAGSGTELIDGTAYITGGMADGPAAEARFNFPGGILVTDDQTIYVADTYNHRIRRVLADGTVETAAGTERHGKRNGIETVARFDGPADVALLPDGSLLIVDQWNHSLRLMKWYDIPEQAAQIKGLKVAVDQTVVEFDVPPQVVSGRTFLSLQQVGQHLGYNAVWNPDDQSVTLSNGAKTIMLQIGSPKMVLRTAGAAGGAGVADAEATGAGTGAGATGIAAEIEMDVAPYIESGRTMVPLRFVAEAFGMHVSWLPEHKLVLMRE